MQDKKINILFVCSRNQWRSPTAEAIWRNHQWIQVRSAGTNRNAKRKVSSADIRWANIILVMEKKHKSRLVSAFAKLTENKPIHILNIPDEYQYMDADLINYFKEVVPVFLNLPTL